MRFVKKIIKRSKKFMIIKTIDLTDNDFWYGVYKKESFFDKTLGRLFCLSPFEVKAALSKKEAEEVFNNMVNYYEVNQK